MCRRTKGSTLQWSFIITLFLFMAVNIDAGKKEIEEPLPLPESSGDYGWFKEKRLSFYNDKLFKYAQIAIDDNDYATAEKKLLEVLKSDPGSNRAKLRLINVYAEQKKWDVAIAMNHSLLETYPYFVDGYRQQGVLAGHKNDTALAILSYKSVVEKTKRGDKRHISALISLSELYFKNKNYNLSVICGEKLIKSNDTLELRMILAECEIKRKNLGKALVQLDAALLKVESDNKKGKIQLARGFILYKQKHFEHARIALEETLQLVPDMEGRLDVIKQLGDIAYQQKRYSHAEKRFKTYLDERFNEDVEAAYIETLIASEEWDKAQKEAFDYIEKKDVSDAFRNRLLLGLVQIYKHKDKPTMTYKIALQAYEATEKEELLLEMAYAAEKLGIQKNALQHYKDYLDKKFVTAPALAYYYLLKKENKIMEGEVILDKLWAVENLSLKLQEEVLYEKAQLYRSTDRLGDYYEAMDQLIVLNDDYRYMMEYAALLLGAGEHDKAVALYRRCLDKNPDKVVSFRICCSIADAYLAQQKLDDSMDWLENALKYGKPDIVWQLIMARIEYNAEDYEACVKRLMVVDSEEKNDFVNLYIGFSFYKMKMPGLALYHFNKIKNIDALSAVSLRYAFYSNRAYLNYDQGRYAETESDVEKALALKPSDDMRVVQLETLIALAEYEKARDLSLELLVAQNIAIKDNLRNVINNGDISPLTEKLLLICKSQPPVILPDVISQIRASDDSSMKIELMIFLSEYRISNMADLLELNGLSELRLENYEKAIAVFSDVIELVPSYWPAYYLRGIAYHKLEENEKAEKDYLMYRDFSDNISNKFWGDLAIVEGQLEKYDEGIASLNKGLEIYPYDIDTLEEAGYQYMKAINNKNAKASFATAIDIYNDIVPLLEGSNSVDYADCNSAMKREYSKLDRLFGAGLYFSKTDYDLPVPATIASIGGALPSQVGVEINYRPPIIGFRNEKTFDIFARLYGNFKHDSWSLDRESYQGGVGIRYKPFRKFNALISAEKLFKIGDNSEDNLLLRALDSIEWGEKPKGGTKYQLAGRLYADGGYFLQNRRRWYYYLDGREGVSWYVGGDKVLITFPQVLGVIRHETDDVTHYLSYNMVGIGINGRFLEPEHKRVLERGYFDIYLQYVWGWFWEKPVDLDDKSFEGIVFGFSFMK